MSADPPPLIRAVMERDVRAVRGLVKAGADTNVPDPGTGLTPLHLACRQASEPRLGIVRELLKGGADPRAVAPDGSLPLFSAVGCGNTAVVEVILSHAPDTINHAAARDGMTPLCLAAVVSAPLDVMELLLSRGATNARALERMGLDFACCPLFMAVIGRREDLVRLLLTKRGMAAIGGLALISKALFTAAYTGQPRVVRMLLAVEGERKKGYWARCVHESSRPLLNFSCAFNSLEVVALLLRSGASETAVDATGESAADVVGSLVESPNWHGRKETALKRDPRKESAIRAMLKRGPAYRARSWAWPAAGGEGGARVDGSCAVTKRSSSTRADEQVQLTAAPFRIYRSEGPRFFVRLVLDR